MRESVIYINEKQTLSGASTQVPRKQITYDKHSVHLWHGIMSKACHSAEKILKILPVKSLLLHTGSFREPC